MSLPILFHFLCTQHVSDINISIIRSLRLCCRLKPATRTLLKPNRTQHNLYFSLQHGHYSNPAAHNTPVLQPATRILLKPSHTQHNLCFSLQHGHYSNPAAYNTPVLQPATRTPLKPRCTQHTCASACNTDTTQTQLHTTHLCFSLQHGHHSNPAAHNTPVLQPATRTPLKPNRTKLPTQPVLQSATRTLLKTNRTKSPTHNEPRTKRPMW